VATLSVEAVSAKAEEQQSECERQPGTSALSTTGITADKSVRGSAIGHNFRSNDRRPAGPGYICK